MSTLDTMSLINDRPQINDVRNGNSSIDTVIRIPSIFGFHVANLLQVLVFIEFVALLILWLTSGECLSFCFVNQLSISYNF